jgi:hypothetical protein
MLHVAPDAELNGSIRWPTDTGGRPDRGGSWYVLLVATNDAIAHLARLPAR